MNTPHVSPAPGPEERAAAFDRANPVIGAAVRMINEAELRGRQQATENAGNHWEQVIRGLNTKSGTFASNWMTMWLKSIPAHRSLMESEAITWGLE